VLTYVWRDLVRNPRRTVASLAGIALGVGLFSGVLFFNDGSGATLTKRALAPLALDLQRVLGTPLGAHLRLTEHFQPSGRLRGGQEATVTLRVINDGADAANEVVVNDEPPAPLTYIRGSLTRDGAPVPDVGGDIPLSQGLARSGLNLGAVAGHSTTTLSYRARANHTVPAIDRLPVQGTISSRENLVPAAANAPRPLTLEQLEARVSRVRGVAAADGLSFVDLDPGALRSGSTAVADPVRVFAFDRAYQRHYPSIRVVSGGFAPGSALLSAEAARALGVSRGDTVKLSVPGRSRPITLPISGTVDLGDATPLFASRKVSRLEQFVYVPDSIVVPPEIFRQKIVPAFQAAAATPGSDLKAFPLSEVDVLADRTRLQSDPARAFGQTKQIAHHVGRIAPGQDYLIDNISNALQVARDDAAVGKRMFLFLGLPGVLIAAFLAGYAGSILAAAQRRDQATLRIRGADRGHLGRMLAFRTLLLAGAGSVLGVALGFAAVLVILGGTTLFEASATQLLASAGIGAIVGLVVTAVALSVPGLLGLRREIGQERRELVASTSPFWQRWHLDFALLAVAIVAEVLAIRSGAFDADVTSVAAGQAVSLPSHLLLAPLVAWLAGVLLSVRVFEAVARRIPVGANRRFGPVVGGTLRRSLRRRSRALAAGIIGVALVTAFGVSILTFAATYDDAKASDARFAVGSDVRITPSVLNPRPPTASYAARLRVPGIAAVTPVVSGLDNSVLIGPHNQDRESLTAIDPTSFARVAALSNSFFVRRTAASAMAALQSDPEAVLVDATTADDLGVEVGSRAQVLFARGSKQQALKPVHVVGLFQRFPGFPEGTNIVANLGYYRRITKATGIDFFLARADDASRAGLTHAVRAVREGPGRQDPLKVESIDTTIDKDRSSLTALNVTGLVDLDTTFTLLMSAAAIAIFVFGLMLQRRREYVTLSAIGAQRRQVRALVVGEAGAVVLCGLVAALVVGAGMAALLVHILRPLFVLDPGTSFPLGEIGLLVALVIAAALVSALAATSILRRLEPAELLREA
jgi:putative ABC transport system permease protein